MENTFEQIVAVSGLPGLYKVAANRHNGLIIEDLKTGHRRFAPSRTYQFSLLASIGIYLDSGDTEELKSVLHRMDTTEHALPEADASDPELRDYFSKVLPDHDDERVRITDIRKMVKWYAQLKELDLLPPVDAAGEEE